MKPAALLFMVAIGAAAPSADDLPPDFFQYLSQPEPPRRAPGEEEWRRALRTRPTRTHGQLAAHCTLQRVREWFRVSCNGFRVAAITRLDDGLHHSVQRLQDLALAPADTEGLPTGGSVTFEDTPAAPNIFLFWTFGDGYDGPLTVIPAVVVQTEGGSGVTVILAHDALHEPVRTVQNGIRGAQRAEAGARPEPAR